MFYYNISCFYLCLRGTGRIQCTFARFFDPARDDHMYLNIRFCPTMYWSFICRCQFYNHCITIDVLIYMYYAYSSNYQLHNYTVVTVSTVLSVHLKVMLLCWSRPGLTVDLRPPSHRVYKVGLLVLDGVFSCVFICVQWNLIYTTTIVINCNECVCCLLFDVFISYYTASWVLMPSRAAWSCILLLTHSVLWKYLGIHLRTFQCPLTSSHSNYYNGTQVSFT
jgi:hypothetical protein